MISTYIWYVFLHLLSNNLSYLFININSQFNPMLLLFFLIIYVNCL